MYWERLGEKEFSYFDNSNLILYRIQFHEHYLWEWTAYDGSEYVDSGNGFKSMCQAKNHVEKNVLKLSKKERRSR